MIYEAGDLIKLAKKALNKSIFNREGSEPVDDYGIAKSYINAGNYQKALPILEQMLKKEPNSFNALQKKAECFEEMGKFDDAIRTYEDSLKVKIDEFAFYKMFGCYEKMYKYDRDNEKQNLLVLSKADISLNDRILKGEYEFEKVKEHLEKKIMRI